MLVGFSQADRTVLKKQLSKCAATIRHRVNIQPDTASCSHAATEAFRRKFGDGTEQTLTRVALKTPRAAAIAGIVFRFS